MNPTDPTTPTETDENTGADLATVHHLRGPVPTGPVVEGEVITEEEYQRRTSQKAMARRRYEGYKHDVITVVQFSNRVARHDRTVTSLKFVARHGAYLIGGMGVVGKRLWEAKTGSRYERLIRGAEARGDFEQLKHWEERAEQAKQRRHERSMDWSEAPKKIVLAGLAALAGLVGFLLVLGIVLAVSNEDIADVLTPINAVIDAVTWTIVAFTLAWGPFLLAAPWLAAFGFWLVGRQSGVVPARWAPAGAQDFEVAIDESTIAAALKALRIAQINEHLKKGQALQYLTPCRTLGRGTHAVIRLPSGVPAALITKKRAELATGLHRLAGEVWPSTGTEAGVLDLWIADKGALAAGAGPYPLLDDGLTDVFKGVPFGKTLRGDPLVCPIFGRNTMVGGMPDQGKSSAARVIGAGVALDPTAEMRIWVPDTNFDFERFKPRCSRYVMGSDEEHFEAITTQLEELVAEIPIRGDRLIQNSQESVTRELASKNIGLHPIWCLLEEAHLAFGHKRFGERIAAAVETIVRLGRKRAIHLVISTQATTGNSVPPSITMNCANGIAFAVARHQENDALLGQGAYASGHRATDLIPGTDKGNAVVRGFESAARSEVAQAYYLTPSGDNDQISPLIARAMAAIAKRGIGVPGADTPAPVKAVVRDLLDDLDEVFGADTIKAADVPALLRDLAPHYVPYQGLDGKRLRELLAAEGFQVPSTRREYPINPVTLREFMARRATEDLDTEY